MPETTPPVTVLELDPATVLTPAGNRTFREDDCGSLMESIRAYKQLHPGLVQRHPTMPIMWLNVDGNRRLYCCKMLGIPYRAIELVGEATPESIIRHRLMSNCLSEAMNPFDVCKDVTDYMERLNLKTQVEVAQHLPLGKVMLSRIFGTRRIPEDMRPIARTLTPAVLYVIAPLPAPEPMLQVLRYAAETDPRPTREQVLSYIAEVTGKKPARQGKPKALAGKSGNRRFEITLTPGDTVEGVIDWLKGLAAKLSKHRDVPPDALQFLFAP